MQLQKKIKSFLETHHKPNLPILVGYSGGGDSLTLVTLLRLLSQECGLNIHLAHVNHRWREESTRQAEEFRAQAAEWGLPFHLHTCKEAALDENSAREQRLKFFKELYEEGGFQALVLAHHGDDQAETILKRLFEGALFEPLEGMQPVSLFENMLIWRPLLDVPKKQLSKWAIGIDDATNRDEKYLRARMRLSLFPQLSSTFGKQITPALLKVGKWASEVNNYFADKAKELVANCEEGPFGKFWDFKAAGLKKIEILYSLKKLAKQEQFCLSSTEYELIAEYLFNGSANKRFNKGYLIVDRSRLFLLKKELRPIAFEGPLKELNWQQGKIDWHLRFGTENLLQRGGWYRAWKGAVSVPLLKPFNEYKVTTHSMRSAYVKKGWERSKVPAFIRELFPLLIHESGETVDFLSGADIKEKFIFTSFVTIEIKTRE